MKFPSRAHPLSRVYIFKKKKTKCVCKAGVLEGCTERSCTEMNITWLNISWKHWCNLKEGNMFLLSGGSALSLVTKCKRNFVIFNHILTWIAVTILYEILKPPVTKWKEKQSMCSNTQPGSFFACHGTSNCFDVRHLGILKTSVILGHCCHGNKWLSDWQVYGMCSAITGGILECLRYQRWLQGDI